MRPRLAPLLAALAAAAALAGCAGATNSLNPGRETLGLRPVAGLGRVLVDGSGRTLYLFAKDPAGESSCHGACASLWPPVRTEGAPRAGAGVAQRRLGTIHRGDGPPQVTYDGEPLYYYQADTEPGDAYGQGIDQFGARWFAIEP